MARRYLFLDGILALAIAGLAWIAYQSVTTLTLSQPGTDGIYHDTYYVVADVHLILGVLVTLILPVALHALVLRRSGRPVFVIGSYVCLITTVAGLWLWAYPDLALADRGPWRYTDYSDLAARRAVITFTGMALVALGATASLTLSALALIQRRKQT
ncbi:hypothetical protein A8B78_22440 [Jannaschia sp. EhC01]|nr:hypothetical protein A8B78_22440 [Jannaschia sp. EhC01]